MPPRPERNPQRVLVIGAGLSGLSAARDLKAGGADVLILEARHRLGGRIHTSHLWPDIPIDLGAAWLHGQKGNPLHALGRQAGLRWLDTDYGRTRRYGPDGQPLPAELEQRLQQLERALKRTIAAYQRAASQRTANQHAATNSAPTDRSLRSLIDEQLYRSPRTPADRQLLEFLLHANYEHEFAGSAADLSTQYFDWEESFSGPDALPIGGLGQLVDCLAQGLDIRLNAPVEHIAVTDHGVLVSGPFGQERAETCLVTVPLGVLKAGSVHFDPPLPADKLEAIAALDMGLLNKCVLRFPEVAWPDDVDWLEQLVAIPATPTAASSVIDSALHSEQQQQQQARKRQHALAPPFNKKQPEAPAQKLRWVEWVSLARIPGHPVLIGLQAAAGAQALEAQSDAQIQASAHAALQSFLGHSLPAPISAQITRWHQDPYSRGSYSFYPTHSLPQHRQALAAPLHDRLFFAGEASSSTHPSTLPGALLSGQRAAQEILKR